MQPLILLVACLTMAVQCKQDTTDWSDWLSGFGHDVFRYPDWILDQMRNCSCSFTQQGANFIPTCKTRDSGEWLPVNWKKSIQNDDPLDYCVSKEWMLLHMPAFDLHYLPPSVSIDGQSMLDDTIAFSLMAFKEAPWMHNLPKALLLEYVLPYSSYHEQRENWRPIFFAKFFQLVSTLTSTRDVMRALITPTWHPATPNTFLNWTAHSWDDYPGIKETTYFAQWSSSTNPPVVSPFTFLAYGYGSCTAFATMLTYIARSVGVPARQAGTPCWNTGEFAGLALDNPTNVSYCWNGGNATSKGGKFLNNHNWVEYWDDQEERWEFINVPPTSLEPDSQLCDFSVEHGCDWSETTGCKKATSGPSRAMRDHEIFAATWTLPDEYDRKMDGGPIVDSANLQLSNGEQVSPLVWSPRLASPLGVALHGTGLRFINRTDHYRCKE